MPRIVHEGQMALQRQVLNEDRDCREQQEIADNTEARDYPIRAWANSGSKIIRIAKQILVCFAVIIIGHIFLAPIVASVLILYWWLVELIFSF